MTQEAQTQIVQFFPEEYQGYITAGFGIMLLAMTLYPIFIKPLMAKSASNQQLITLQAKYDELAAKVPSIEEINAAVNTTLSAKEKADISKNILDLQLKLPYADEETKIIILAEIERQKVLLNV